ncbi:MAG: MOP flippase family protein [Thermodesulfobacteriota bacterium]|nr:MOP flippase family protein [Thermodesulfobacteriota bacterium]
MSLKLQAAKGIIWSSVSRGANLLVQVSTTVILARLLLPEDFGVVAVALMFITLASILNDMGLSAAIIQRQNITEEHLSTMFYVNIATGFFLTITMIVAASLVANFFQKEILRPILTVLSVNFIINSLGMIQRSLLEKQLEFFKIAVVDTISLFLSAVIGIGLAVIGQGVWSLVWQFLSYIVGSTVLLWTLGVWRPQLIFKIEKLKELFGFGLNLVGSNLVSYGRSLDTFLIGKFLGPAQLGYYSMAQRMVNFPLENVSSVVTRVLFPAFSKIQGDKELSRASYLKTVEYISFFTFPMMAGLFVIAPEMVRVVFGMKWESIIILIQIICFTGLKSIGTTTGIIYLGNGRADIAFRLEMIYTSLLCIAIGIGLMWGAVGVAAGYTAVTIIFWPISHYFANRIIGLSMRQFFSTFGPVSFASVLMLIILILLKTLKNNWLYINDLQFLLSSLIIGPTVYLLVIKILKVHVMGEIVGLLGEAIKLRQLVNLR